MPTMQTRRLPVARTFGLAAVATLLQLVPSPGEGLKDLGPNFDLDLNTYRRTDPDVVLYRETASVRIPVEAPRAIALDGEGTLYVGGDGLVAALDRAGSAQTRWSVNN